MYLGINAYSHDSSAALVTAEGRVLAAVEEERFTRRKKESAFPAQAIACCLRQAGITPAELDGVALAWHPWLLLRDRIFRENLCGTRDMAALRRDLEKTWRCWRFPTAIEQAVGRLGRQTKVRYYRHHHAHAASAFFGSPFEKAAFLTMDGRGERESATWGTARGAGLHRIGAMEHPDSYGKLYSGMARFCGFWGADAEGTAMAFAGLGKPVEVPRIRQILGGRGVHRNPEAAAMNTAWLDCRSGHALPTDALARWLDRPARAPRSEKWGSYPDLSASTQIVLEEAVLGLATGLREATGEKALVLAGGVALNSVSNGRLMKEGPFPRVFVQPAAHDGGLAIGCGLLLAHEGRTTRLPVDADAPFYGPGYTNDEINQALAPHQGTGVLAVEGFDDIAAEAARIIAAGGIVAWFQGRLEFGPRALGNRSLLADARDRRTVERLNRIKGRESFRPFAITILHEERAAWLAGGFESPHMLVVDRIRPGLSSRVPAASHVDGTVRTQTLRRTENPVFHRVLKSFFDRTGVPLLVNTSLNVKGEPIACSPSDAIRAFLDSEMDVLMMNNLRVTRADRRQFGNRKNRGRPGLKLRSAASGDARVSRLAAQPG